MTQENERSSVKAMAGAMSAMQEKLDQNHSRVKVLEAELSNLTVTATNHSVEREEPLTELQHSARLPGLVARLTNVIQEYDMILSDLPHGQCALESPCIYTEWRVSIQWPLKLIIEYEIAKRSLVHNLVSKHINAHQIVYPL